MSIEEDLARSFSQSELEGDTVLAIGVFDGVHLGHKHLLATLKEKAREHNFLSGAVTFNPPPQRVLQNYKGPLFLTSLDYKIELLGNENVDAVFIMPFDRELAHVSAAEFVRLMQQYLRMKGLVVGQNFALGRDREGNIDVLMRLGEEKGFEVTIVPPLLVNGEAVSSTLVRKVLARGDMGAVYELLGRPFRLHGKVIAGVGRGMALGFPTANLSIEPEQAIPVEGVYASLVYLDDLAYKSMTYIGSSPTFSDGRSSVEIYVLDYSGDLYGRELRVDFVERIRGEVRFDSIDKLKHQIAVDIEKGRALLDAGNGIYE
ncbi:MAG: bifunctional riboflavin kinase/FAD synthetase [Dehalococcoidales bacterium]